MMRKRAGSTATALLAAGFIGMPTAFLMGCEEDFQAPDQPPADQAPMDEPAEDDWGDDLNDAGQQDDWGEDLDGADGADGDEY